MLLLVVGPVLLLFAWHRPLHPLPCPVSVAYVCGAAAAAATVYSSIGISCRGARRLHGGAQILQLVNWLEDRTARRTLISFISWLLRAKGNPNLCER